MMQNKYPIYIVSKGRWEKRLTADALERMKTPYYMVVEKSQYDNYAQYVSKDKLLILPQEYLDNYETCDELGASKSKGPGAARNFAWEHSMSLGFKRHWVMDDNISDFYRCNDNRRIRARTPAIFRAAEDFVDRYENVYVAGLNYRMFIVGSGYYPPFITNTRIYSCLLILNDIPYRWRGRYNEDTDLSLRVLKDGHCTVQFNAFLADKIRTQILGGGNTAEFYAAEGTLPKSKMLVDLHPDVSSLVWKFKRVHHHVDYTPFKANKLKLLPGLNVPDVVNNYGMKLVNTNELDTHDESD